MTSAVAVTTRTLEPATGLAQGAFPERLDQDEPWHDRWARSLFDTIRHSARPPLARARAAAQVAQRGEAAAAALDDGALRSRLREASAQALHRGGPEAVGQALALAREGARRSLAVFPYGTQLMGAAVLLEGRLAEMQTGEGKTLTAALAATIAAAAGVPTHVVTVNDYLARRDAAAMGPLMRFFGLQVGLCTASMPTDRKLAAYACPVTYCTNQTLVFDYLRDRVAAGGRATLGQVRLRELHGAGSTPLMLRGLHFAIIDEADAILIDEARTPLILSESTGQAQQADVFREALDIARTLLPGQHFRIDAGRRELILLPAALDTVRAGAEALDGVWRAARGREQLAIQALRALHLYARDQHYVVLGDKVQIVDEYTGRVLDGRKWEGGLQQMIETKEGLPPTEPVRTLARITFQRFFCRYLRLAGMTGTASEVAAELRRVYRLDVVRVPTHRPDRRVVRPGRLLATTQHKWALIADTLRDEAQAGRPALIGTRSVEASERLSSVLKDRACQHRVLNARQDAQEAELIAQAGQAGAVTVATNMAGRGTDILLGSDVAARGGLIVLLTELHDSARIDRQLMGRCARQGDPGIAQALVALDDEIFAAHAPLLQRLLQHLYAGRAELPGWWLPVLRSVAQAHAGRLHAAVRRRTLKADRRLDDLLGFAGNAI